MTAFLIGTVSGIISILIIALLKLDKPIMYGLILSGIGFLYPGYTWTDTQALILNAAQAILFAFIAYYGIKKNFYFLVAGYFLHGVWDFVYHLFQDPSLLPPHYDLFCWSIDWVMGGYLLILQSRFKSKKPFLSRS